MYACYTAFNKARLSLCLDARDALRDALIFVIAPSSLSFSLFLSLSLALRMRSQSRVGVYIYRVFCEVIARSRHRGRSSLRDFFEKS